MMQRTGETLAELDARAEVERGDAETLVLVSFVKPGEPKPVC
jgi:hypothetical protein